MAALRRRVTLSPISKGDSTLLPDSGSAADSPTHGGSPSKAEGEVELPRNRSSRATLLSGTPLTGTSRPRWPPLADPDEVDDSILGFNPLLLEGPIMLDNDDAMAGLFEMYDDGSAQPVMYQNGTVWLKEALLTYHGRGSAGASRVAVRSELGWRELQVAVTSPKGKLEQRLTGGLSVVLSHSLPSEALIAAHQTPNSCGFTVNFLPGLMSVWNNMRPPSGAGNAASDPGHVVLTVHHGDVVRVLVCEDGWCDVVCCLHSAVGKWKHIAGWQTPLNAAPLYAAVGLRHNTIATLRKTIRTGSVAHRRSVWDGG